MIVALDSGSHINDDDVWRYAAAGGFTIVSKDADASRLSRERRFWLWAKPLSLKLPAPPGADRS